MADNPKTLVSTEWLMQHLKDPDLRVLDASWYLPDAGRDPKAEYNAAHIPGARFFDIDDISDARSEMPHMAPPAEKFMSRMRALGVGDGHQVVVYDGAGLLSAARVWWLFRLMGQENVAVLDGGLPKWQAECHPIEDMPPIARDRHMTVRFQNHLVRDVTQVAQASKLKDPQIVDARSAARFRGEAAGIDLSRPVITSCGSGITAAILALALERVGHSNWSLYDGSWAEWGMFPTVPVATGEA